jgi:hypothetical protein
MANMAGTGLAQLVEEIKLASANIRTADDETRRQIRAVEESVNDLYRKVGRPGKLPNAQRSRNNRERGRSRAFTRIKFCLVGRAGAARAANHRRGLRSAHE